MAEAAAINVSSRVSGAIAEQKNQFDWSDLLHSFNLSSAPLHSKIASGFCCRSSSGPRCSAERGCLLCVSLKIHQRRSASSHCQQYNCLIIDPEFRDQVSESDSGFRDLSGFRVPSDLFNCHGDKPWWHYFLSGLLFLAFCFILYRLFCSAQQRLAAASFRRRLHNTDIVSWPHLRGSSSSVSSLQQHRRRSWHLIRPLLGLNSAQQNNSSNQITATELSNAQRLQMLVNGDISAAAITAQQTDFPPSYAEVVVKKTNETVETMVAEEEAPPNYEKAIAQQT